MTQTLQVPSAAGITTFADTSENAYWDATNERGSTMTAGSGVTVTVTGQSGTDLTVEVGQTSAG